jgi:hypothetical protein
MEDTKWSDWIEWNASTTATCPIAHGTLHRVKFKGGEISGLDRVPELWNWKGHDVIVAYRYELPDHTCTSAASQHYEDHKTASLQILCTLLASRGTATDDELTAQAVDIADQWLGKLEQDK